MSINSDLTGQKISLVINIAILEAIVNSDMALNLIAIKKLRLSKVHDPSLTSIKVPFGFSLKGRQVQGIQRIQVI